MRHVDISGLELLVQTRDAAWNTLAEDALLATQNALAATQASTSASAIEPSSSVWGRLKPLLVEVYGAKCWYCEAPQTRWSLQVDHFRPKAGVQSIVGHPGYWWLAFRADNFRIACQFCNSGGSGLAGSSGKGTRFPLIDETKRASAPTDALDEEWPTILDPTIAGDCALLAFADDGTVHAADGSSETDRFRANFTIRLLGLDAADLQQLRRDTRERVEDKIGNLRSALDRSEWATIQLLIDALRDLCETTAAFSSIALATVSKSREPTRSGAFLTELLLMIQ